MATCTEEEHAAVAAGLQFGQPTLEEARFFNITDAPTLKSYLAIRCAAERVDSAFVSWSSAPACVHTSALKFHLVAERQAAAC